MFVGYQRKARKCYGYSTQKCVHVKQGIKVNTILRCGGTCCRNTYKINTVGGIRENNGGRESS
jgi:hypothetical protein